MMNTNFDRMSFIINFLKEFYCRLHSCSPSVAVNQKYKIRNKKRLVEKAFKRQRIHRFKLSSGDRYCNGSYRIQYVAISFFRLFKDVYGVSPYQYIKQKRMQKANEIMKAD
jgi:methylphosphotriester-DNA--protein-cysteine methyltransferase